MGPPSPATRRSPPAARAVAWSGAVVFGVSLIYFLYSYLVRFEADPSAAPGPRVLGNVLLFSLFALHHSICARAGVKAMVQRAATPLLERPIYNWAASLLFILTCALWMRLPGELYRLEGFMRHAAYAVQVAGLVVTARAAARLDIWQLAGVRPLLATGAHAGAPAALETTGLYGLVRHPVYSGWLLLVFGTPDMTHTRLLFAAVSTAYLVAAVPLEERSLVRTFGDAYLTYRRQVRWRILPWIY